MTGDNEESASHLLQPLVDFPHAPPDLQVVNQPNAGVHRDEAEEIPAGLICHPAHCPRNRQADDAAQEKVRQRLPEQAPPLHFPNDGRARPNSANEHGGCHLQAECTDFAADLRQQCRGGDVHVPAADGERNADDNDDADEAADECTEQGTQENLLFHGDAPFLQSERLPNRADIAPGDVADLSALQADANGAG